MIRKKWCQTLSKGILENIGQKPDSLSTVWKNHGNKIQIGQLPNAETKSSNLTSERYALSFDAERGGFAK